MKVSKLVTYMITGGLCVILLVFLVRIVPLLLLASHLTLTPQTPPTLIPTNDMLMTMPTVVSVIGTPAISPSSINAAASQETTTEIPLCAFSAREAPTPTTSSLLDAYTFSEPQVVLTSTTALRLCQWLPDSKHWLISRLMTEVAGEYIETFDLSSREIKRYAERRSNAGKPLWLPDEQAVAFVDSVPPNYTRVLYVGRSYDLPTEELATDLANPLLSLSSDGKQR